MPVYEYEHVAKTCVAGAQFEYVQPMAEDPLTVCPRCGEPVKRLISLPNISVPQANSALKNMGFSKLVRRDEGVYENVTALDHENRYMEAGKPETMPDLSKRISD
jgi:putative FmdB family regulatory protein